MVSDIDRPDETSPSERSDHEARIVAYLDGEMSPDVRTEFEREMEKDDRLRREVSEWREALAATRDWMTAEAPGVERAKRLKTPSLIRARRQAAVQPVIPPRRSSFRYVLAAAALFAAGFIAGILAQRQPPAERGAENVPIQEMRVATPTPRQAVEPGREAAPETRVAAARSYMRDENGRLLIETPMSGSGGRAYWVVDGRFQLAQVSSGRTEN